MQRDGEPEGALHLFQLAGRFVEVITEMTARLADVFAPTHAGRQFWVAASQGFYDRHLRPGQGLVLQQLEHSGRSDVVRSFVTMLNLIAFVDLAAQKR